MDDDMHIPLRISGQGFEPMAYPGRIGFQLRPPGTEGSFSMRDWPFGDGELHATIDGYVTHLGAPIDPTDAPVAIAAPVDAVEAEEVEVRIPFGARIASSRSDGEDETWIGISIEGIAPARWTAVAGAPLHVATDANGVLAELRFSAPVRRPQARRLTIASEHGWQAASSHWFTQDGESFLGVSLHRAQPPVLDETAWMAMSNEVPPTDVIHEPGLDGTGGMVVVDGHLEGFDGQSVDGQVELPSTDAERDEIEATITWPNPGFRIVVDQSTQPPRARFELGIEPERWVRVGGQLLVGLAPGDEVGAIVLPELMIQDMGMDHTFMDPMAGLSQAEMLRQMADQMEQQNAVELERARAYAQKQSFAALGPVDPPNGVPVAMRMIDGPFGDGNAIGVILEWGDMFARVMPEGDRAAPLVMVTHQRQLDHMYPEGMGFRHDDALNWLQGEQMARRQWAVEAGESEPLEITQTMAMVGPEHHDRQLAALEATAEPVTLIVDGEPLDATIVRIDGAFAVRAERGGWKISVCATGIGQAVPELRTITELDAFVEGRAAADQRMRLMHLASAEQLEHADPTPPEPTAARDRAEVLMRSLQGGIHMFPGRLQVPVPDELFTAEVVAAQGGIDACRQRLELVMRVAQVSGTVGDVARDGSVAHGTLRVDLPRPDGMGVGMTVACGPDWWDHDPGEIRKLAALQPTADQQGEYELAFNVLLERQPDGLMLIATDVLGLLDEHLGGLERLLEPSH